MHASLHGLLRVFPVLRRPGRARTLGDTARLRLASLGCARSSPFASAKQRALRAAFIARPPPHPSHSFACEGPSARKTLRGPRSSKGNAYPDWYWSLPILLLVWVACASPRKAEGFFGLPARTHQLCEGCGGGGCEKRCQRRVFQGLQRRLNAAEGALGRRRCEPVARHRNTGKTRSSTCGEASTGVAPRLFMS